MSSVTASKPEFVQYIAEQLPPAFEPQKGPPDTEQSVSGGSSGKCLLATDTIKKRIL